MNGTGVPDPVSINFGIGIIASIIGGVLIAYLLLLAECIVKALDSYNKRRDFKKEIRDTVEKMFWDIQGKGEGSGDRLKTRTKCFQKEILQLKDIVMIYRTYLGSTQLKEFIRLLNTVKIDADEEIQKNGQLEEDNYQNILDKFREIKWLNVSVEKLNFKSRSLKAHTHRGEILDLRTMIIFGVAGLVTPAFIYMLFLMGSVFISTLPT